MSGSLVQGQSGLSSLSGDQWSLRRRDQRALTKFESQLMASTAMEVATVRSETRIAGEKLKSGEQVGQQLINATARIIEHADAVTAIIPGAGPEVSIATKRVSTGLGMLYDAHIWGLVDQ